MENKDYLNIDFFRIQTNNIAPKKGRVLIADPFSSDFFFTRSVVLLTEYSPEEGAMGFILNKPVAKTEIPSEVYEEFGNKQHPRIYHGGPVGPHQMFYIHKLPSTILTGSMEILPGLYWGGDFNELAELLRNGAVSLDDIKFFIGYSGWSPGQLEKEIKRNYWVIAETNVQEVLGDHTDLWKKKLYQLGPRYAIWTHYSKDPELN